ncbi:unnamed protein product [Orchesella dallaii]|uniref:C2H2-type domain-containing protein n=1 Tax=Orchesella dallaii TaxID=48710 RepID=A0ABP1Q7M9_9HEXA
MDERKGEVQVDEEEVGNEYIKVEFEENGTMMDADDDYFQLLGEGQSTGGCGSSDQPCENGGGRNGEQQRANGKAWKRKLKVGWSNWMEELTSQIHVNKKEETMGKGGGLNQFCNNGGRGRRTQKVEGACQGKPERETKLTIQRHINGTDKMNNLVPQISRIVNEKEDNNDTPKIPQEKEVVHCLLCFEKILEPKERSHEEGKLGENLKSVFILRKLLNVPYDEMTNYLMEYGDPSKWIGMCENCEPLTKEALGVNDKMNKLMNQLDKCREQVVKRIQDSVRTEGSELRSRCNRICKNCKNGECLIHRQCLTEKIRTLVLRNNYPLNPATNPYLDGDKKAEAKYNQSLQLSQVLKAEGGTPESELCMHDDDDLDRCNENEYSHSEAPSPPKKRKKSTLTLPTKAGAYKIRREVERHLQLAAKSMLSERSGPLQPRILGRRKQNNASQIGTSTSLNKEFRNYNCFQCPHLEPFKDMFSFVGHIIFHYDYPFQCSQCNIYFPLEDIRKLENHWKRFHADSDILPQKRYNRVWFESHDAFQCPQCCERFPFSVERDTHVETVHKRFVLKKFTCITCNEKFISRNEMVLHRAIFHPEIAKFSCFACDELFKSIGGDGKDTVEELRLRNHIKSVHSLVYIPIVKPCPLCGSMFDDSVSCHKEMNSHIKKCHTRIPTTLFPCKKCNRYYSTAYGRQLHHCDGKYSGVKQTPRPGTNMRAALAEVKVTKQCELPHDKRILTLSTPKQPDKIIAVSSYSCPTCPNLVPMKLLGFLQHIAFHHERPYKCVGCSSYFQKDDESVDAHWNEFHKENFLTFPKCIHVPINIGDVWKCTKCKQGFSSDDQRDIHERDTHQFFISDTKKKYNCVTCANQFRSLIEWQFHRALKHPEVAELSCYYCDERFELRTNEGISLCDNVRRIDHSMKDHTDLALAPLYDPCRFCGHCFDNNHASRLYTTHLQNEHKVEESNLFPCVVCSFSCKDYKGRVEKKKV